MSELKFGFCRGGLWQMARAEVGVMFTGEIKKKETPERAISRAGRWQR